MRPAPSSSSRTAGPCASSSATSWACPRQGTGASGSTTPPSPKSTGTRNGPAGGGPQRPLPSRPGGSRSGRTQPMTARVLMLQGTASWWARASSAPGSAVCCARTATGWPPSAPEHGPQLLRHPGGPGDRAGPGGAGRHAGVPPHVDMNPILLAGGRLPLPGRAHGAPRRLHERPGLLRRKLDLWPTVSALDRLRQGYDVVVIEGAGSPAEVNLRERRSSTCASPVTLGPPFSW